MIQTVNKLTPAQVAAFTFRMAGDKADPEAVANRFRADAAEWRAIAAKAAASASGMFKGVTESQALHVASDLDSRAVSVPAELRKLLG